MPRGILLALSIAVLTTHIVLLSAPSLNFSHESAPTARALTTRTITVPDSTVAPSQVTTPRPRPPARRPPPAKPSPPPSAAPTAPQPGDALAETPTAPEPTADTTVLGPLPRDPQDAAAATTEPASESQVERPPREDSVQPRTYALPGSARLSFDIEANRFPYTAEAELVWRQDGRNYQASMAIRKIITVRSQTSAGQIGVDGLMPTRFADKSRSELAAHFDREGSRITFSANTADAALLTGTQDQLSLPLQIAAMVAGEPDRFERGTTLTIQVVGPREASLWLLSVEGPETLTLPIGDLATLKLQRNPRQPYDQKVELWLAPRYGYLPARIRLTQSNGDYLDQRLLSVDSLN